MLAQIAATFKTLQDIAGNYLKTVNELVRVLHERYSVRAHSRVFCARVAHVLRASRRSCEQKEEVAGSSDGESGNNSEAAKMITTDKDGVLQSVTTSHENHVAKIITKDVRLRYSSGC